MLCSSSTLIIPFAEDAVNECNSVVGIATSKPKTVVTSACDIPPAISLGSPVPYRVIIWKVTIIPVTVPNKPANGATTEIILTAPIPLSIEGLSDIIASASFNSNVSISFLKFSSPTLSTLPSGFLTSRTFDPA